MASKKLPNSAKGGEDPNEYNIFRDSALRYMGYANEIGESFRYQVCAPSPQLNPNMFFLLTVMLEQDHDVLLTVMSSNYLHYGIAGPPACITFIHPSIWILCIGCYFSWAPKVENKLKSRQRFGRSRIPNPAQRCGCYH